MEERLPTIGRVGAALLGLAFLVPGHYMPWVTFQSQWVSALGVGCIGLATVQLVWRRSAYVAWTPLAMLALLSAGIPVLQRATGQILFVSDAVLPALYLIGVALAITIGSTCARLGHIRWLDDLFDALTVAAAASVLIASLQWLGLSSGSVWVADVPRGGRPFANLGQPNHLATLLALGLMGTLRNYERRRTSAMFSAIASVWLGLGLVMTQSRTGWLFIAGLLLWWAAMRRRAVLRIGAPSMVGGVLLFAAAVMIWDPLNQMLLIAGTSNLDERMHAGPRGLIWHAAVEAMRLAPWAGYGWNQVTLAQQAVALDGVAVGRMFQNAHNTMFDLALWAGLPFALLWAAMIGAWLVGSVRRCKDADMWCVLGAVGAIGLHAMLEYPLEQTFFLLPLGLFAGALSTGPGSEPTLRTPAVTLALPLALMLGATMWIGSEYLKIEQANRDVRLMLAGYGIDKVPYVPPPEVRMLDGPREYHRFMITSARAGMNEGELDWMQRVMQRNAFPPAMFRYALAAGLNGRPDDAALTLKRLCSMHSAERCDEARASWKAAQEQFPKLRTVPAP